MLMVTGANGQLGRGVVEHLTSRIPAAQVAVSVRDPEKASAFAARGVDVRRGDFAQPETLAKAFAGATDLLLVSSNAEAYGGDMIAQQSAAIDAAREAGVRRILYTSHMGASATSAFPPMRNHARVEALLANSGVAFTSLRHGFYSTTPLDLAKRALETGVIAAPADGKVSWTAREDLAEADAIVLASGRAPDGATAPWTAGEALDLDDVARMLSAQLGREIKRVVISDDEYRAGLVKGGVPEHLQALILGLWIAARNGEFRTVDPTLASLLGRPPRSLRDDLARLTG